VVDRKPVPELQENGAGIRGIGEDGATGREFYAGSIGAAD
jgi:hypothetical protein